jgi:hypothetical protein
VGHLAHFPAGLRATAAGFGALPAMVHVVSVFFAFSGARFTNVGAQLAYISGVRTVAGHKAHGGVADFGAVAVETDAFGHHLHVLFAEAGVGAVVAGHGAGLAGFNAILIFLVCHVRVWICLVQPDSPKTYSPVRKEHLVYFFETN